MNFKRNLIIFCVLQAGLSSISAITADFSGSGRQVIQITPEKNTGLDVIYVVYDISEVNEFKIVDLGSNPSISKYSNMGGGFAEPVQFSYSNGTAVVNRPEGNMGYIITDGNRSTYIWVVDYKPYMLHLESAYGADTLDCDNTVVNINGQGDPIYYFSIDGRRCELSRDIEVKYSNLEWSDESESYIQNSEVKILSHLMNFSINPPLYCNSTFTISGDRFLSEWGIGKFIESSLVYANGISAHTSAIQTNLPADDADSDPSNIIKGDSNGMGGSAPADITFRAWVTDAVVHNEWQLASDEEFEYIDARFNEQNLDYTFTEEGTYYLRYVGSNADGTCETYGDTYTVSIGSSELKIPNAFTPNDDGMNDIWKVAYRSLLSFSCTIFDRYGTELFHFNDPSQGWDGKYKGKSVKPGVYFYVIEAVGSDGKKYKKGGDINIINSKRYTNSGSGILSN